ncbi:hypothetical protein [Hydrogenophaga sp. 2FB]|uniref:DUF883 family protein n=1 Tax=Hydrogenophaga sp. 2FB TaxID=2502187 RepID=UPI0010F5D1DF|nr:hypothetical protein [Hydrogenophaga sp. 2FB]
MSHTSSIHPSASGPMHDANAHRDNTSADGSALVSRVAQGLHETVDRVADKATPAVQKLESTVAHANESMHDQLHRARELGDEWTTSLRGTVREHPLTSIVVALAAGALIARISR